MTFPELDAMAAIAAVAHNPVGGPDPRPTRARGEVSVVNDAKVRWWDDCTDLWAGVFKGGGAKGVAYAGALQAVAAKGIWFAAVAGSSAGAITATLVAAGFQPDRMDEMTSDGLASLRPQRLRTLLGVGGPQFDNVRLREWVNEHLVQQLQRLTNRSSVEVSFRELFEASGIELHVVAMDLSTGTPVVFNAYWTPEIPVADAVIASCAIPMAFPTSRALVEVGDDPVAHLLADGGLWANYPAFVFRDASFRHYYSLPARPEGERVVGFSLDSAGMDESPTSPIRILKPWEGATIRLRRNGLLDLVRGLFKSGLVRAFAFAFIPLVGAYLLVNATRELVHRMSADGPAALSTYLAFSFILIVPLIVVLAVLFAWFGWRYGREFIDVGPPSARALLGVSTGVPRWIGAAEGDHCIRVPVVPPVQTTQFNISEMTRRQIIDNAGDATRQQLEAILSGRDLFQAAPSQSSDHSATMVQPRYLVGRLGVYFGLFVVAFTASRVLVRWNASPLGVIMDPYATNVFVVVAALSLAVTVAAALRYGLQQPLRQQIHQEHIRGDVRGRYPMEDDRIRKAGLRSRGQLIFRSSIALAAIAWIATGLDLSSLTSELEVGPSGNAVRAEVAANHGRAEGGNTRYEIIVHTDSPDGPHSSEYYSAQRFETGRTIHLVEMHDGSANTLEELLLASALEAGVRLAAIASLLGFLALAAWDLRVAPRSATRISQPAPDAEDTDP